MSVIDIKEILKYKVPDSRQSGRDVRNGETEKDSKSLSSKRRRIDESINSTNHINDDILEQNELSATDVLDEHAAKRLILNFDKRVRENQQLRTKHPDDPTKFMESEVELNVAVQEMHALATVPEFYHLLIELGAINMLLQLITHENSDISIAVVDLLQELTDVESEKDLIQLIDAVLEGQIVGLLVQNVERLDETVKDEADGVHNTLALIENMSETTPQVCVIAAEQGLLQWILKRLKAKMPFDGNKLYASEILAILVQDNEEAKKVLGEFEGVDILLQQLALYKRHNPNSSDEFELMENLFNCLCAALLYQPNRIKFLKGEGLQLMNLMLREKKMSRSSALRVLNYATSGRDGKENCDKLVDILGLRTIFPLFMKTPNKARRKGRSADEHEEHVCSVLSSLLANCGAAQKQRILVKFLDDDHAKVDRLIELHFKYSDRVNLFEKEFMEQNRSSEDFDEDELYLQKLDAGLFTLQQVDSIVSEVCVHGASSIKDRVHRQLNMRGGSVKTIKNVLREYANNIGEGLSENKNSDDQERLFMLIEKL